MGMQDRVRQILVGFSQNKVGFCTAANVFITGTEVTANPTTIQSWRVVKYAADSVAIFGAGVHLVTLPYSSLPPAPTPAARTAFFFFGNRALKGSPSPKTVTSLWSSVVYEIGVTGP
jgi:hypothetical protein